MPILEQCRIHKFIFWKKVENGKILNITTIPIQNWNTIIYYYLESKPVWSIGA